MRCWGDFVSKETGSGKRRGGIARYQEFHAMRDIFRDFDWLDRPFEIPYFGIRALEAAQKSPRVDLIDEGSSVKLVADIPGARKDGIKLRVAENSVSISASTEKAGEVSKKNYYYSERSASSYYRSIPLQVEVDPESARAKFVDGTLEVVVREAGGGRRQERFDQFQTPLSRTTVKLI